jgi:hypothetical protein
LPNLGNRALPEIADARGRGKNETYSARRTRLTSPRCKMGCPNRRRRPQQPGVPREQLFRQSGSWRGHRHGVRIAPATSKREWTLSIRRTNRRRVSEATRPRQGNS